jgi:hypothetical protein
MHGLCLACGAPFLPAGEEVNVGNKLANMSVMYFQRQAHPGFRFFFIIIFEFFLVFRRA